MKNSLLTQEVDNIQNQTRELIEEINERTEEYGYVFLNEEEITALQKGLELIYEGKTFAREGQDGQDVKYYIFRLPGKLNSFFLFINTYVQEPDEMQYRLYQSCNLEYIFSAIKELTKVIELEMKVSVLKRREYEIDKILKPAPAIKHQEEYVS